MVEVLDIPSHGKSVSRDPCANISRDSLLGLRCNSRVSVALTGLTASAWIRPSSTKQRLTPSTSRDNSSSCNKMRKISDKSENNSAMGQLRRECFVTVGATASFRSLIDGVTSKNFLETLSSLNFTDLTIQCGPDLDYVKYGRLSEDRLEELRTKNKLVITLFDYNSYGLGQEMKGCKMRHQVSAEGIVISHAGAGSILDAMRIDVPIIVVPNPELLDNHQEELARELERQGYVTYADLRELPASLKMAEAKNRNRRLWVPADNNTSQSNGVVGFIDDELGYETYMREILD